MIISGNDLVCRETLRPLTSDSLRIRPGEMEQVAFPPVTLHRDEAVLLRFNARFEGPDTWAAEWGTAVRVNGAPLIECFGLPLRLLNRPPWPVPGRGVFDQQFRTLNGSWLTPVSSKAADGRGSEDKCAFVFDVTEFICQNRWNVVGISHTRQFLANVLGGAARLVCTDLALLLTDKQAVTRRRAERTPPPALTSGLLNTGEPFHPEKVEEAYYSIQHGKKREQAPQIVFDRLDGWNVVCHHGIEAAAMLSREKKLFSDITAKLTYRATGPGQYVELRPPAPVPLPAEGDALDVWIHEDGGLWRGESDSEQLLVLLTDAKGSRFTIDLGIMSAGYWFLEHGLLRENAGNWYALAPDTRPQPPLAFSGFAIGPCTNAKARSIYLDSLAFYREQRQPPAVAKVVTTADQPFTSLDILPTPAQRYRMTVHKTGTAEFQLVAQGGDGDLVYTIRPRTGTFSDVSARFGTGLEFQPMRGGGLVFEEDGLRLEPGAAQVCAELVDASLEEANRVCLRWRYAYGQTKAEVLFTFELHGRTLTVDITSAGGFVIGVRWGAVAGLHNPRRVFTPHLSLSHQAGRSVEPVCAEGLFILGLLDWRVSEASVHVARPRVNDDGTASFNTGCEYQRLSDGTRRDLRERMFLAVSPLYEEVLPNVPNPVSPNRERLAPYMYSVHINRLGSAVLALCPRMHRLFQEYGLGPFIDMMHAPLWWRRGGEGFDMRTEPRPEISDERLRAYTDLLYGMGHLAGMLTEYNDYDPASIYFHSDQVCLNTDGTWQRAWAGCYAAKLDAMLPVARAVDTELKRKYHTDIVYYDTHTNIGLLAQDFEAGGDGAGTARSRAVANARLIRQSCDVIGALTSEGMQRWIYAGITDMDFAYVLHPFTSELPLLPVFDLLKIHPQQHGVAAMSLTNQAMMKELSWPDTSGRNRFEQYLADIIAYGHMGDICPWFGWRLDGLIKFWAMLFDLQQEYLTDTVAEIRYHDGRRWLAVSEAIRSGAYRHGRTRPYDAQIADGILTFTPDTDTPRYLLEK